MLMLVWNGALAAGIGLLAFEAGMGWETPLPRNDAFFGEALVAALGHMAVAAVAWRILRGDRWAYRLGFAVALLCWLFSNYSLFWGADTVFSMYRDMPEAKYLVLVTLSGVFTVQLALFALSVRARAVR